MRGVRPERPAMSRSAGAAPSERRDPSRVYHATLVLLGLCSVLLVAGIATWRADITGLAEMLWAAATAAGLVFAIANTVSAVRLRKTTIDVIAILALIGALAVREWFAGAMVAMMLASGGVLEARASARAVRELSLLVQRAPRMARRRVEDIVAVCPVADVAVGDRLLVRTGEVVPVDGRLTSAAVLDESALTGEPLPVEHSAGQSIRSGVVNGGQPLGMVATATAANSTYTTLVRLVDTAKASSAPFVRVADRFALVFVPLTLLLATGAWVVGGPVRAVAVLVVATPCPLLLAAPIAFLSGLSRAAARGVVVKGADALERLADADVAIFDKTGTLTLGRPALRDVITASTRWESVDVLHYAASLDQVSSHVLADPISAAARGYGVAVHLPESVEEVRGYGIRGVVDGHSVQLGKASWIVGSATTPDWVARAQRRAAAEDCMTVFVAVDGEPVAAMLFDDRIRRDAARMIRGLRVAGISRVVLLTGDRLSTAARVGRAVGVDEVLAERDPAAKVAAVQRDSADHATVMVGDGINDAPALAAAHVGVALAARGATASSEAADVVLTADRVDVLADAIRIARRSKRIALQAVVVGMGLSLVAMGFAAAGAIPPAVGAVGQEAIDVLAIGIALRAVLPGGRRPSLTQEDIATTQRLQQDHDRAMALVDRIRAVADALSSERPDVVPVRELLEGLDRDLLAHERADEQELIPIISRTLGTESTLALRRGHAEIEQHVGQLRTVLTGAETLSPADVVELRRILYGLYAIVRLHNAQEDEQSSGLIPDP